MFKRRLVLALGVLGCLLLAGCELFQQPPVARFVPVYNVDETDPRVVNLDASASNDPNGEAITQYQWSFGEDVTILTPLDVSKTVTVPVLTVRYPLLNEPYTVTLVVVNEIGEMSAPVYGAVTPSSE